MKYYIKNIALVFCCLILVNIQATFSQVRLPKLISDGMILQRDTNVKIWGWASSNEKVSVNFIDSVYRTIADDSGNWEFNFSNLKPGGPYSMTLTGNNKITINDILVGDVWICSGQSNMELSMKRVSPLYETEIKDSENPYIRYFYVPRKYNFIEPLEDFESGKWMSVNPETVLNFSAVSYFFAAELFKKYKIPVGLINASLGGSPAEAWISEDALKAFPEHYEEAERFKDSTLIKQIIKQDRTRIKTWYSLLKEKDGGYNSDTLWFAPDLNTSGWETMNIPGYWADTELGQINGVVWFRKKIDIPFSINDKNAKLILGRIVEADSVFINGVFVGTTSYQYPPRRYDIPPNLLKQGENSIVIRVINEKGNGGFLLDKNYDLVIGKNVINLEGEWHYKLGAKMKPLASQTFIRWKPMGLYNAMINPILNYSIKGVIWYQGESNASRAKEYVTLFPTLINNWREKWKQGNFPFIYVQLPNFMESRKQPSESSWALLREAQLKTLSVPNTAMAVTIDIGEWNDIHPLNKKDVGKRLALAAQKIAYGDNEVIYSSPIYQSAEIEGNKIIITFTNIGSGLVTKGNSELKEFAIAGKEKQFVWAKAKIENNKVIVWSDQITNPVAVRYAWADNPENTNLYNIEGLPASPFRSDDW